MPHNTYKLTTAIIMSILVSCSRDTSSYDMAEAMLTLNTGTMSVTRTTDPDEERITDLNIFIFDETEVWNAMCFSAGIHYLPRKRH